MGKNKRTELWKQGLKARAVNEYASNAIEQHNFDRLMAEGVIAKVEKVGAAWVAVEPEGITDNQRALDHTILKSLGITEGKGRPPKSHYPPRGLRAL